MAFSSQMHLQFYVRSNVAQSSSLTRSQPCQGASFSSSIPFFGQLKSRCPVGSFLDLRSFNQRLSLQGPVLASFEAALAESGGGGDEGTGGRGRGDGDDGDSLPSEGDGNNQAEAMLVLATLGKTLSDLPADLAKAVRQGRIPGSIIRRFFELEKVPFFRWLLQFGGMKERLLADDLFMTKVAIECGVGTITKTAAELERRRENFSKELDFVIADVMMAIIADFMLVFLPAPTVPLGSLVSKQSGLFTNIFRGCPDNAFQVALAGTSYSLLQRFGAIVRNGGKLFCVATSASLIGTSATNVLIYLRKTFNKDYAGSAEDVPILSMSIAYGAYAAVSSNLRYQFLAGVVEQRMLQPLLENNKLLLSATCFVVRTGNTFLGSLMWVDYARWVGVQKIKEGVETTV